MSKSKKDEAKAEVKLPEASMAEYFVVRKNVAEALMGYLQDKPYKETAQLVQALGGANNLKQFTDNHVLVD